MLLTLDAPNWLWLSVVELIGRHEVAYLEHCRKYASQRQCPEADAVRLTFQDFFAARAGTREPAILGSLIRPRDQPLEAANQMQSFKDKRSQAEREFCPHVWTGNQFVAPLGAYDRR